MKKLMLILSVIIISSFINLKPLVKYKGEKYYKCYTVNSIDTLESFGTIRIIKTTCDVYDAIDCNDLKTKK